MTQLSQADPEKTKSTLLKQKKRLSIWIRLKAIPFGQKFRYILIIISCLMFFAPLLIIPGMAGNPDLCGKLCMRRFYLYYPGMSLDDFLMQISVAWVGVAALILIFVTTFFWGRMWCAYVCPVGGLPELVSRSLNDHWKIEYRSLPQVPIRYGYFTFFVIAMPTLGISACTLCNFITVPRIFEAFADGLMGISFIFSTVGIVNLALLFLLGFFSSKGRAYCQLLCPIGAMDGLINRAGAKFRFTRHIRVERDRCTGCNICARNCMTGAIKMVDRIAIVDQHSCMSCHECVDVCDWDAIDWLAAPKKKTPKRIKKGINIYPQVMFDAHHLHPEKPQWRSLDWRTIDWQRVIIMLTFALAILFIAVTQVFAAERQIDPDGCLSCHALPGLRHIDKYGVIRNASINQSHYLGSLHGSVPCKDCHRRIKNYPHEVENGEVDCNESCHVEEPSDGEPYTHKRVVEEFESSVHGKGNSKGFTGGNRRLEAQQNIPSCRQCHSNEAYINAEDMPKFKESFDHFDSECGSCHQGDVWRNQFSGHILRRILGSRWSKTVNNRMCNACHADHTRMSNVEVEDKNSGKKKKVSERFIEVSHSYAMTLHSRLLASGVEAGASCIDCHAPKAEGSFRHNILGHDNTASSTHPLQLAKTCAATGCHGFANNHLNHNFVKTDMHDIDMITMTEKGALMAWERLDSNWSRALLSLVPVIVILGGGSLLWLIFGNKQKRQIYARFGGTHFQKNIVGRRQRKEK